MQLKRWLPQLMVLEYPIYFSPMAAWYLEEQQKSEAMEIQRILKVYETSSGQQLNCHKTSLCFSPNTNNGIKERVKTMFGAQVIKPHEAYLGLPSLVGRSKNNTFAQLKQRVANKVAGWREKILTPAGKEILIKFVAQVVPSYTMNCFCCPRISVMSLLVWSDNFGGDKSGMRRKLCG